MKERPIMFTTEMVQAILDGRKIQTRRFVKPQPFPSEVPKVRFCPQGVVGDHLWVKETWAVTPELNDLAPSEMDPAGTVKPDTHGPTFATIPVFKTDYMNWDPWPGTKWRSSRFMPRWASRLLLEITEVRTQRVQSITPADAWAEGIPACCHGQGLGDPCDEARAINEFWTLWDSINGKKKGRSWKDNPWVWVIEFKNISK